MSHRINISASQFVIDGPRAVRVDIFLTSLHSTTPSNNNRNQILAFDAPSSAVHLCVSQYTPPVMTFVLTELNKLADVCKMLKHRGILVKQQCLFIVYCRTTKSSHWLSISRDSQKSLGEFQAYSVQAGPTILELRLNREHWLTTLERAIRDREISEIETIIKTLNTDFVSFPYYTQIFESMNTNSGFLNSVRFGLDFNSVPLNLQSTDLCTRFLKACLIQSIEVSIARDDSECLHAILRAAKVTTRMLNLNECRVLLYYLEKCIEHQSRQCLQLMYQLFTYKACSSEDASNRQITCKELIRTLRNYFLDSSERVFGLRTADSEKEKEKHLEKILDFIEWMSSFIEPTMYSLADLDESSSDSYILHAVSLGRFSRYKSIQAGLKPSISSHDIVNIVLNFDGYPNKPYSIYF